MVVIVIVGTSQYHIHYKQELVMAVIVIVGTCYITYTRASDGCDCHCGRMSIPHTLQTRASDGCDCHCEPLPLTTYTHVPMG